MFQGKGDCECCRSEEFGLACHYWFTSKHEEPLGPGEPLYCAKKCAWDGEDQPSFSTENVLQVLGVPCNAVTAFYQQRGHCDPSNFNDYTHCVPEKEVEKRRNEHDIWTNKMRELAQVQLH
jgi:hypothetical protein